MREIAPLIAQLVEEFNLIATDTSELKELGRYLVVKSLEVEPHMQTLEFDIILGFASVDIKSLNFLKEISSTIKRLDGAMLDPASLVRVKGCELGYMNLDVLMPSLKRSYVISCELKVR